MFTFLPVVILLFAIAVYMVYFLFNSLMGFSKSTRLTVYIILIAISVGFILTFIILNFFNSFFWRSFYLFLSLMIGYLFYLTMAGFLVRLLSFFQFFKLKCLAWAGFIGATLLFIIGICSIFSIQIRSLELKISNLPEVWQGKKIVQISDLHLGSIYGTKFIDKVASRISDLKPDYLVITGDLFDGHLGELSKIGPELKKLTATTKVIFIPGNHDKYIGLDNIKPYLDQAGFLTLIDEAVIIDGVEIIGFDYLNQDWQDQRQIKNLSDYQGQPRLLLNHTPTDITRAKDWKVNLQLSGHSHKGQMWPVNYLTRLIYGRYHYGFHSEGPYNINTTSGLGTWGPPLRTFNRPEIVQIILK